MPSSAGRSCWFHCFAGVAGDMVLGALLDAGAPLDEVTSILDRLGLPGWSLRAEPVERAGLAATRAVVDVEDQPARRTFRDLAALVDRANLPDPVVRRSSAALRALAEAEAKVHRVPVDDVHLHELGGHDTLIDVVGSAAALYLLGVTTVTCSPVAVGTGTVASAHGRLPNPAPAVVALLAGAPVVGHVTPVELTTPTGAALMATWAASFGPLPPLSVDASGFGAGSADLGDLPNCVQVVLGAPVDSAGRHDGGALEPIMVLETTVDDVTGESLARAVARLLQVGALDAWVTPAVMKHGRPGHVVAALARPAAVHQVRTELARETGSLGVRVLHAQRWVADRHVDRVEVAGQPVRVKVGPYRVKAEHRDVVAAAERLGWPAHQVAVAAEDAWRQSRRSPDSPEPAG